MILILLSFFSAPLEGSGDAYLGYYPTRDTLYNIDVSMWVRSYIVRMNSRVDFFAQYSSYLEMAEQQGKVVFDPAFSTYSIIVGFQYSNKFYFSFYLDHWCRHLIDRELEEGKAVFNALNFEFSNIKDLSYRFLEDYYFRADYVFYPQGIFVDWLNSKSYYRHRIMLSAGKKLNSFCMASFELEYTVSNDNPRQTYYLVCPEISIFKGKKNGTFYSFLKYNIKAKGPLRSPENKIFFGIGYYFNTPCRMPAK
jgi:hypothetical protein